MSELLTGRRTLIKVEGIQSSIEKINQGVPQGSLLGNLLFIIATEDLNANNMLGTYTEKYADDATFMVHSVYGTDIYEQVFLLY